MTFLELCQMVARESGTISGNLPASTLGQTGRLAKVVAWTAYAWTAIQNRRNSWRWMVRDFEKVTLPGAPEYTPAAWSLPRVAEWQTKPDVTTIYRQSMGPGDEGGLIFVPWDDFKRRYRRGIQQQGRPTHFSVSPTGSFCLGPTPDVACVVKGEYRATPQRLTDDGDVPEMPARFHEVIAWEGLLLLAEHDEAGLHIAVAQRRKREIQDELERDQLPMVVIGGEALA